MHRWQWLHEITEKLKKTVVSSVPQTVPETQEASCPFLACILTLGEGKTSNLWHLYGRHRKNKVILLLCPCLREQEEYCACCNPDALVKCFETPHANISFLLRLCEFLGVAIDDFPGESRKNGDLS